MVVGGVWLTKKQRELYFDRSHLQTGQMSAMGTENWFVIIRCVFICLSLISTGNSGLLRIPINGQLVYDTLSKTADLCLSPHMCPPCMLGALCQLNMPGMGNTHSTEASSAATTTPTPTTSLTADVTSSSAATTISTAQTPTEEPTSSASTPTGSSSTTEVTATTEATATTATSSARPTGTDSGIEGTERDFLQTGLNEQNKYRKIHNSSPLTLSSKLNSDAQATAKRIATQGKLIHTDDTGGQGESLAKFCTPEELTPAEIGSKAVNIWYKEVCKYNFNNPSWSESTGHFTQLVWASTRDVGMGWDSKEEKGKTCYYVAARYYPKGNVESTSQFQENVKKGSFDPSYCDPAKKRELTSRKLCHGKGAVFWSKLC